MKITRGQLQSIIKEEVLRLTETGRRPGRASLSDNQLLAAVEDELGNAASYGFERGPKFSDQHGAAMSYLNRKFGKNPRYDVLYPTIEQMVWQEMKRG